MSDDVAPYSGAIEEAAKTTGKALDLVKEGAQPIADIYGLLIGDTIHAARHRRLDAITRRTKQILKSRDLAEAAEVAEQIAIPLLQAAQAESREEMQELWARLLANAMDPSRRDDVRPAFIRTLNEIHPADALILSWMGQNRAKGWLSVGAINSEFKMRQSSIVVILENLVRLGCCDVAGQTYVVSNFGVEFLIAVQA